MNYTIRITRQAMTHLREIRRYIEVELAAPDAALNTIRAIRTEIAKLSYMPQKIQTIDEFRPCCPGTGRDPGYPGTGGCAEGVV